MNNPAVLLVDKPSSALDHERGAAILDLITTLTHRNATATVLVTHDRAPLRRGRGCGGRRRPPAQSES